MYLDLDDDIIDPQFGGDMCVLTSQFLYMHCSAGSSTAATFQSESTKLVTQPKLVSVLVPP